MLYAGDLGDPERSYPVTSILLASKLFQNIICFGPPVQFEGLSSHHTAGWAGATAPVPVAPVTLHLKPSIYILGSPHLGRLVMNLVILKTL